MQIRKEIYEAIRESVEHFPVVALIGPRQSGKTTLARALASELMKDADLEANYMDLEDPTVEARLTEPKLALSPLRGLVVIDEVQRLPSLFPLLRVLADRPNRPATFLILGSASQELIQKSSESLAGRIKYIEVLPFGLTEVGFDVISLHWLRGGYPLSFLSTNDDRSDDWRAQYVRTFLEHDLRLLGIDVPPALMRRLWMMLSHFHGQTLNTAEIAQSLDISATTAKKYIDILVHTFMVRRLQPWHENIAKRQVKTPKLYFRDSGLFHHLLGIKTYQQLLAHPALGRSWEGYVTEQIIRSSGRRDEDCYFWGVHSQGELDLLIGHGPQRIAMEVKHTATPSITPSIKLALQVLKIGHVDIVYPGQTSFPLSEQVSVLTVKDAIEKIEAGLPG